MDTGSWLYGIDSWYNIYGLPSNFLNHYEMTDYFFNKSAAALKSWDHDNHTLKEYQMATLYGLDNASDGVNDYQRNLLSTEYVKILKDNKITATDLNDFNNKQLYAPAAAKLPTTGCN